MHKDKIVLAYSGGLDTSIAIKWLQDNYNNAVITACIDLDEDNDLMHIQEKALKIGAEKLKLHKENVSVIGRII